VDEAVSARKPAGVSQILEEETLTQNRRKRVPTQIPRNRNMAKTYTETQVEATGAMLLISKAERILANDSLIS
jgi:hypothetical protein